MSDTASPAKGLQVRSTSRSLPIALLRAREKVMAPLRAMLADAGVTEQQWRVLRVLAESGPMDPTEIASASCLLMPSLTRILRMLETKGYCTRRAHETDRRRMIIEITRSGVFLIETHYPEADRIFAGLEAEFGNEKLERLLDLLNELTGR